MSITGSCLCGSLRFEVKVDTGEIYQCHCSICRKATGSSANANIVVKAESFKWLNRPETLTQYSVTDDWISSFCSKCGSKAPCESEKDEIYYVPAGSLNESDGLEITKHIFVGSKASWDTIGGDAEQRVDA